MAMTATESRQGSGAVPALPGVGDVVEVRGAAWAVTNVTEQGLSRSPADEGRVGRQHVVSLQSLEEDRMGEELSVVWELEVGQTIIPSRGLPDVIGDDSFDDPNRLGAFVDAMRWGAVTSADDRKFEAPFRTGANLEAYQLEPLRRAIAAPRTNLLLADDVGLGKTVEAGMVIQELLLRHRARTVIIVCPPSLCLKWQEEMRGKFGLDFEIVNAQTLADARRRYGLGSNPFRLFPRVIVSMAWVPSIRAQRLFEEVYADTGSQNSARRYSFDVLVVDEAHHVAPSAPSATGRARGYAVDSKRTIAVRRLAEHCEHRMFLSATPHNGYTESFTALLEMIDSRRFARGAEIDAKALQDVIVRRLKTDITDLNFRKRRIETIPFTPGDDEEEHYQLLDDILKASARQHKGKKSALGITGLLFKKRLLSSPDAFSITLGRYLEEPESGERHAFDDNYYAETMGSGQSDEEEGLEEQPEYMALRRGKAEDPLQSAQAGQLDDLLAWSQGFQARPNARLQALIDWLDRTCRPDGRDKWNDERVVVFTEYADTLDWMYRVLDSHGYSPDRLAVIDGATAAEDRELIRARFNADPGEEPVRVLLATDAAGEGIDLQAHCHRLVNFDVPFNPSRLEQRIGRIDRYGQTQTPEVYYFGPTKKDSSLYNGDLEFVERLAEKVAVEKQDLGNVNPLVDRTVDRMITDRFMHGRSSAAADDGNELAKRSAETLNRAMAGSMELNQRLTDLASEYDASRKAMHLSPQSELRVVDTALELTNQPPLIPVDGKGKDGDGVFRLPELNRSWRPIAEHLHTPLDPTAVLPITFDRRIARKRSDVAYEHLGSELVAKAARTLRGNLYGQESQLHRVTAVVLPGLEHTCAAAVSRMALVGRGGLRVHEEVFVTGMRFGAQNMAGSKVQDLLATALDASHELTLASPAVLRRLREEWEANDGGLRTRLENAVGRQAEALKERSAEKLQKRRDADLTRAGEIFEQFRANLRDSLDQLHRQDEESPQLMFDLFTDDERRQRQRDIRKMEDRLDSLDDEERRELDMIRTRYQDIKPYTSIAALVFAVSEQDARAWEEGR